MNHLRVLEPVPGVYGFYDGRVDGYRFADEPNWVDQGALSLGICSYAIADGDEALVYDTHVSVEHAEFIRRTLEAEGVRRFRVLLSHWHLDHVAGTAAFPDAEVISSARTAELLARHREQIEGGTHEGPPAIRPLILPDRVLSAREAVDLGTFRLELLRFEIHSDDATVVWLPEQRLLLAGDTLEDTVTYVGEPDRLDVHLSELERMWELAPERILPSHGDPEVIAAGGYPKELIRATEQYIECLLRSRQERKIRDADLRELVEGSLEAGWIHYFEPYEAVHRSNIEAVLGATDAALG